MNRRKHLGFTVIELMVVIIVIVVLTTISSAAYRSTQSSARDEKRRTDSLMLKGALEEYRADNGEYPLPGNCSGVGAGGANECYGGEAWTILQSAGYIDKIPYPGLKYSTYNYAPDGNAHYVYLGVSPTSYGMLIPMESGNCKTGKNIVASWWGSLTECNF